VARAKRRGFTAAFKQKVLAEADAARASGEIGAVLRHHGLYSSHLTLENRKLQRENERLTEQLRKAEIVIDVQKKVAALLGRPFPETETL
jgi:transposase-like protein